MIPCDFGGHLVDGNTALPTDPIDRDVDRLPIHGCTQLRCPNCKAMVRNVAHVAASAPQADLRTLHELADLASTPLLIPRPGARLYLCRCLSWSESIGRRALAGPDPDPSYDPQVPWRCAGHPVAALPHGFDGVEVTADNLAEIVAQALRGHSPAAAHPEDRQGGFWVARLHTRLAQTPWQETVTAGMIAALTDADAKVRSRAIQALFVLQLPAGAERAVALLAGDRAGFAGVPEVFTQVRTDKTLEESLWRLATPLVALPGQARELARADALTPGKGRSAVYGALASGDAPWVAAHIEEIARANPDQVKPLSDAVRNRFRGIPAKPVVERLSALFAGKA